LPLVQSLRSSAPTLVAGSTWPADETPLLEAWAEVRKRVPDARLIIAPHEVTDHHLTSISRWAAANGLRLSRISSLDATSDIVLVDRYGILGDLYAVADIAYVGGGFHAAGLHSVLEPAAFGVPVLFGPRHHKSREASALIAAGGAQVATDAADLCGRLVRLLKSREARDTSGAAARAVVEGGLGAAERSYTLVRELLGR
jgi:3-deoxy-D-manno-octulosonic-acid transferase